MRSLQIEQLDFDKSADGLLPAIVQDQQTLKVLMLGYVNQASLEYTLESGKITFFSRSKNRLWTKGESSGNFLMLQDAFQDCDSDAILLMAKPVGPVCHTGSDTCFEQSAGLSAQSSNVLFLDYLETHLRARAKDPITESYTARLLSMGINKVAQKVGEEAIEMVIEAKDDDSELFLGEAADLLFHYLLLLQAKNFALKDVIDVLSKRHKPA